MDSKLVHKKQTSILSFINNKDENYHTQNECLPVTPATPTTPVKTEPWVPECTHEEKMESRDSSETRYPWMSELKDAQGRPPSDPNYDPSTVFIPDGQWKKFTPFERQYWEIKSKNFDSVVFFKKGKFFELYENDADLAATLFDLKVTDRVNMKMAGVPEMSFSSWAVKFVNAGYKVVKVDQAENLIGKQIRKRASSGSADDSGIIERTVSAVLSRGTLVDPSMLGDGKYSFCAFVFINDASVVDICVADISLGIFTKVSTMKTTRSCLSALLKYSPKEVLYLKQQEDFFCELSRLYSSAQFSAKPYHDIDSCEGIMCRFFDECLMTDLKDTLRMVDIFSVTASTINLTGQTLEALDLYSTDPRKPSVWRLLNQTCTSSGSRKLLSWLVAPLKDADAILRRQCKVIELATRPEVIGTLCRELKSVPDLERLINLSKSTSSPNKLVREFINGLLAAKVAIAFLAAVPEGDIDKYLLCNDAHLGALINERLGVESLLEEERVAISKRLGSAVTYRDIGKEHFLLEIDSSVKVPSNFLVMSRTKSLIRYWTAACRELATKHNETVEKIRSCTENIYKEYMSRIFAQRSIVSEIVDTISDLDCIQSLARFSETFGPHRCMPEFLDSAKVQLTIRDMKHPLFASDMKFVSNDISASFEDSSNCVVLTGPNMGGKSTFMKQLGVIVILAQMGSFVPASLYFGTIFKHIYTRIGAEDDILNSRSTFRVELDEVNSILASSGSNEPSFAIVDEFGRGTSTHDGVALAEAVLSELYSDHALLVFSTHYKRLALNPNVQGSRKFMRIDEVDDQIVYQYKLIDGVSPSSFAGTAALSAGIPADIVSEAQAVSSGLTDAHFPGLCCTSLFDQLCSLLPETQSV